MRFWPLIVGLLFQLGCSTRTVSRDIASVTPEQKSEIDLKKSFVQIFPNIVSGEESWYYFYVVLKDHKGRYIDCPETDLSLKTISGKKVPFKLERILLGRYYVNLKRKPNMTTEELTFFVQGKPLKENFKLYFKRPEARHSKIVFVKKSSSKLTLELHLADKNKRPVDPPDVPEVILDGVGEIGTLKHIREGVWEFTVIYPDQNQIMYFSVRSMGVYLSNLFRYQHVEK